MKKEEMHEEMEAKMGDKDEGMDEWEIDSAVEALLRAEKIKKDPALFEKVMKKLDEKKKDIVSLEGMRKKANKMDRKDTGLEE